MPTADPVSLPESSPLGRAVAYPERYAPELLFPIERAPQRAELGILRDPPFVGEDLWNAWELSWLEPGGKPVVALGTLRVPASSPRLIESKSLKLYLNSLNRSRFDDSEALRQQLAEDLSQAAGARVGVSLDSLEGAGRQLGSPAGTCLDDLPVDIDRYTPAPDSLRVERDLPPVAETLFSRLFKSNCPVTGQPDWATVVVRYRGPPIDREGLLRYLVSFREHQGFHEHCVERIFMDLRARCEPQRLAVWARFLRRGGLDINPYRADAEEASPPPNFGDPRQ